MNGTHRLTLDSRSVLEITAVEEVLSFDDTLVSLSLGETALDISGEGLSLKRLSLDCGEVTVEGRISAMVYFEDAPRKKRFSIFGR